MIKFWKSAAKGKSGCPVRPPEPTATSTMELLLDTISVEENEDLSWIFEKKSKLNLTLYNILIERNTVKYLIEFMETIGKHALIKCWLELENFKCMVINQHNFSKGDHCKISRAKSFDMHCKCSSLKNNPNNVKSKRLSWKEHHDIFPNKSSTNQLTYEYSASSCSNLSEPDFTECNNGRGKEFISNITEEAINIFKKYVALEAPCKLELPDEVRKSVITNICQPEGQIMEDCFKSVQDEIYIQIETKYFEEFQKSPLYIKAQIDILTSDCINLSDILHNETILFYFTEYLEQESHSILLEFLMAIMHFRENLKYGNNLNSEQTQADAIVLYDKYFSLQASSPIGFPTDVRLKIENEICREQGPLPNCFDSPYTIVFKTLSKSVKAFLESEIYYRYLSEMIHSVDQLWSSKYKTHSDCSSEFSISTQNTLLAMGDPRHRTKKRNHSVPDMTIDSNQLYNADALWQRRKHDGLNLGRVNSLGRFESKFEPDPDKRDKSVLKRMVSRFVSNTSRVDEEMAWQIAHMIVKDVTDLTMAPPDNENECDS